MAARRATSSSGGTARHRVLQLLSCAAVLLALVNASPAASQQLAVASDADDERSAPLHDLIGLRCHSQSDCGYLPSLACIEGCVVAYLHVSIALVIRTKPTDV